MANIALIETTPSSTDFHRWFDFEFDRYGNMIWGHERKTMKIEKK